jgi:curved DNA-binding protein
MKIFSPITFRPLQRATDEVDRVQKNPHQILGIASDADLTAIKLAFRRLAHRYHPDISSEPDAGEKFAEITAAYRLLQAEEILKANRHKVQKSSTQSGGPAKTQFNSKPLAAAQASKSQAHKNTKPANDAKVSEKDCELTAHLSIEEFYWGAELKLNPSAQCPGRRTRPSTPPRLLNVKIRRGMKPGQRLRIKDPDRSGSIYLTVELKPHDRYDVVDNDLYVDLPLSSWEAKSGAVVDVVTPGGRLEVDVPAGISSGQMIRVPQRGLPQSASEYGDLFAVARVVNLDERTRKMQRWPHVPHRDVRHWAPVGGYRAGNSVDVFA